MDKIICVGKNYLAHAQEIGDAIPDKPVLFLKPPIVLKQCAKFDSELTACFPENCDPEEVQAEGEIVICLKKGGYKIKEAQDCIAAVTLGLDMTLRKKQTLLKQAGHPWTTAKVFPDSALIGPWIAIDTFTNFLTESFIVKVNNQIKQQATGNDMRMSIAELIIYISQYFPLCPGDLIFTGTPAGVPTIHRNDKLTLTWDQKTFTINFI